MLRANAVDAIKVAANIMKRNADKGRMAPDFSSGKAYLSVRKGYTLPSVQKAKLGPQRVGPFNIKRTVGKGNAMELELPGNMKIHPVVSVVHLEPHPPGTDMFQRSLEPPDPVVLEGEMQWHVEKVLNKRVTRKGRGKPYTEYLVRWKGYNEAYDT